MIVVRIELWPGGAEDKLREIGRMYIANVGGTQERGDYTVAVCRKGSEKVPAELWQGAGRDAPEGSPKATRAGSVRDYPRLAYNVWRLVCRALASCFPEESTTRGATTHRAGLVVDSEDP